MTMTGPDQRHGQFWGWLAIAWVVLAACQWRGGSSPAWTPSILTLLVALSAAFLGGRAWLRPIPWLALVVAAIAGVRCFGDALWPCPVSCQGGGHYQRLLGLPAHLYALAALFAIAVAGFMVPRRPRAATVATAMVWLMAGGSVFYLWVAANLHLRCGYCFAVHTGVLALAALTLRFAPPVWWQKLALAAFGFLALNFAYGPHVVSDGPEVPAVAASTDEQVGINAFLGTQAKPAGDAPAADPAAVARVDAVRRLGRADAPLVVELAIDLHCPHCARTHGPLLAGLRPLADAGRIEVVQRFLTRKSDPTGRELAGHALAAADSPAFSLMVATLLGTPEGRGWAKVRSRIAEIADPTAVEAARSAALPAIDAVLAADGLRLKALGCRETPFVILTRRDGHEVGRWLGEDMDPAAVAKAVP